MSTSQPQQQSTSALAIAGFIAALLGASFVAVGLSAGGLTDARHGKAGRGLAMAGMVLGVIGSVLWLLLVASVVPGAWADAVATT